MPLPKSTVEPRVPKTSSLKATFDKYFLDQFAEHSSPHQTLGFALSFVNGSNPTGDDQMGEYEFHPLANLFPMMEGPDYEALVKDIRESGLREPIWLYEGKILDGRNRYRACLEAGVEPAFRNWEGSDDPIKFVVSANLHRRHLNESQRAIIAADLANLRKGQKKPDAQIGAPAVTLEKAAKIMNVGRRTVQKAKRIKRTASPEILDVVKGGKLSIDKALVITQEAPEEQKRIALLPEKEMAAEIKTKKEATANPAQQEKTEATSESDEDRFKPILVDEFEAASATFLSVIKRARDGKWTELPYRTVQDHLMRFNAVLNGAEPYVSEWSKGAQSQKELTSETNPLDSATTSETEAIA